MPMPMPPPLYPPAHPRQPQASPSWRQRPVSLSGERLTLRLGGSRGGSISEHPAHSGASLLGGSMRGMPPGGASGPGGGGGLSAGFLSQLQSGPLLASGRASHDALCPPPGSAQLQPSPREAATAQVAALQLPRIDSVALHASTGACVSGGGDPSPCSGGPGGPPSPAGHAPHPLRVSVPPPWADEAALDDDAAHLSPTNEYINHFGYATWVGSRHPEAAAPGCLGRLDALRLWWRPVAEVGHDLRVRARRQGEGFGAGSLASCTAGLPHCGGEPWAWRSPPRIVEGSLGRGDDVIG